MASFIIQLDLSIFSEFPVITKLDPFPWIYLQLFFQSLRFKIGSSKLGCFLLHSISD